VEFLSHEFIPSHLARTKGLSSTEELVIAPIGDVHFGARGFAESAFKRYLEAVENEFDNVWYVGMGDYLETGRTTLRKTIARLEEDDGEPLDNYVEHKVEQFSNMIKHTKGRWLGMLQGNHTWSFRSGQTTETMLCEMLDAQFLGDCGDVNLRFQTQDGKGSIRGSVGLWLHHGVGGRKYPVGKLVDDICPHFPDSDIFLMGHTHIREYRDFPRLHRVGKQYIERTGVAAITGGWLGGYIPGKSTYVERKAYKPRAIGSLVIKVRPRVIRGMWAPVIRVETI
jgi:hypothetical protein